ncbi:MAG: sigma factor-like helix-turn-helix DNA-binding protein [Terriglobales bacterium]
MNVHITYKAHKTPDIDKEIQHWIAKIEKRLQVFRPELIHLKGALEQNSPREGTVVSLNLRLPSGQMAVHESAPAPTAAIKAAFSDLLEQIGKHKELLRSSHSWRRHRTLEGVPAPAVPFEETFAAVAPPTATSDDVRSYLNANLRRLRLFIEREIYFRENSGDLGSGAVNVEEVLDESVARALDEKIEKPDRIGLEPWLYRLAIRSLDDFSSSSISEEIDIQGSSRSHGSNDTDGDEARLQFFQPDETITAENGIADDRASTPEQIAYSDEMISLVQFALRRATRPDREAFILFAIEGFSLKEIAAIVDRSTEHVQQSIHNAREALRHGLPVENRLKDKLLQRTASD